MKPILDWLVSIGGSPVDVLLMGIIIAGFVMQWNQKRIRNAEIKDLTYKYDTLNTNVFSIDKHTNHNGFKRGNSQGDFMLDWDGKPEQLMTVNMFKAWIAKVKKKRGHIDTSKTEEPYNPNDVEEQLGPYKSSGREGVQFGSPLGSVTAEDDADKAIQTPPEE